MRILIVGYGSMGREVEKALLPLGHFVAGRIDISGTGDDTELTPDWLDKCDGVIEFALGDSVIENMGIYARSGKPVVMGTTGWQDRLDEARRIVGENNASFLYGSNFSIGAHLFFMLAEKASSLVDNLPEYDFMLHEYHHKNKKDSPSGTALTAAKRVLSASSRKDTIVTQALDRRIEPNELHVSSTRGGSIPGTHTFTLDSDADTIVIQHSARSRGGFALGAVRALEWLTGKTGFFTAEDFITDMLGGKI